MRILIVAATRLEVPRLANGRHGAHDLDVLVTGVGMVATAARCARALTAARYDLAINVGVCGAFDPATPLGTVVHVVADRLSELGAEDGDGFLTMEELGLMSSTLIVNDAPPASAVLEALPRVTGVTVNTVHGHERSIAVVRQRFNPGVESMEGAAFAHACALCGVPYAQVRAVSNLVERRNRDAWRLALAVERLNDTTHRMLDSL